MSELYVIRKRGYFYLPNARGYTARIEQAWRVPKEVAEKHERPGHQPVTIHPASEFPMPESAAAEPTYTAAEVKELVEALRKIRAIEIEVWDESQQCTVVKNRDDVDPTEIAREALKKFGSTP